MSLFFKISVKGLDNLNNVKAEGLVLVSNHQSYLDPVVLGLYSNRRLFFMAKSELFRVPLFKHIIKKLGAFPVKRGMYDLASVDFAKKIVEEGKILAMFPEGTRSKSGNIMKFKNGAVKIAILGDCRILPCSILYVKRLIRPRIFVEYGELISLKGYSFENLGRINDLIRLKVVEMYNSQKENVLNG